MTEIEGDPRIEPLNSQFAQLETRLADMETRLMRCIHSELRLAVYRTFGMVFSLAVVLVGAMAHFA